MRLKLVTLTLWWSSSFRPASLIAARTFHSMPSSSTIVPKVRLSTATVPVPATPAVPTMIGAPHPPRTRTDARTLASVNAGLDMAGTGGMGQEVP